MLFRALSVCLLSSTAAMAEVPRVATDILPVQGLAQMVLGDLGTAEAILPPGASPHDHALRPSEAAALNAADVVFQVGGDLAPGLARPIAALADTARVVTLLNVPGLTLHDYRDSVIFDLGADDHGEDHDHDHEDAHDHGDEHADDHGHDDHGHEDHGEDHAHGHDHAEGASDPHAWLDPGNAKLWLSEIANTLAELDPENAATYAANAAAAQGRIDAATSKAEGLLADVTGAFVVFHDAYQYYETAFDLSILGAISASDAAPPSPRRLDTLRDTMVSEGIVCLFAEPQYSPGLVAALSDEAMLPVAVLDPLGSDIAAGAGHYPALLVDLATRIADCGA